MSAHPSQVDARPESSGDSHRRAAHPCNCSGDSYYRQHEEVAVLTPLRLAVKVRTNNMTRVLNGLTHPTALGASKLMFANPGKATVTPEIVLLLNLLREEASADIRVPSIDLSEHLERPEQDLQFAPRTARASELAGVNPPDDWIPPPPPSVICEFDLGLGETTHPTFGKRAMAIFGFLVFQVEGKVTVPCEGVYDGQEAGSDSDSSGIWRTSNRRERNAPTERVNRPTAKRAANF